MNFDKNMLKLYAVTDNTWIGEKTLLEQIESALKGGVTCVQLREKKLEYEKFLSEAIEVKKICNQYNVPLLINDNVKVAVQAGADGVHIGQNDMNPIDVRKIIGKDKILGVTVSNTEEAIYAQQSGADYLGVGAVFSTSTKLDAEVISHEMVLNICNTVDIPIVAIGGINIENILQLSNTGVDGIALVSAIFAADDIENRCKELLLLSEKMLSSRRKIK